MAAAGLPHSESGQVAQASSERSAPAASAKLRKIPIGVFDPVFGDLPTEQMIEKLLCVLSRFRFAAQPNPFGNGAID